ncbi:MAG: hypothetical protein QXJ68_07560 [Methanocellales archaeon]
MKREVILTFERATKNTYRFAESPGEGTVIGTLYVQKHVFAGKQPSKIKVTIEWD